MDYLNMARVCNQLHASIKRSIDLIEGIESGDIPASSIILKRYESYYLLSNVGKLRYRIMLFFLKRWEKHLNPLSDKLFRTNALENMVHSSGEKK